jgi:biopolymer transport protein ExbD
MRSLTDLNIVNREKAEVNLSPLIDMVFLLLIFFMVTSVFVEETGVDVQKPKAASARELDKKSILIAITPDGKVVYGGKQIGVNGVRGLVARLLGEQEMPVILLADETAQAGVIVDVIDECKLAGGKRISIAANRE